METLILEDFRCFAGRNEVPIRPLTLLVGENSTGKTSFLAAARVAHDLFFRAVPDFNEDPFRLGSYDQIANYRRGHAKSFVVGQEITTVSPGMFRSKRNTSRETILIGPGVSRETTRLETRFQASKSQPSIASISASCGAYKLTVDFGDGHARLSFLLNDEVIRRRDTEMDFQEVALVSGGLQFIFYQGHSESDKLEEDALYSEHKEHFDALGSRIAFFRDLRPYGVCTHPYEPAANVRSHHGGT